MAKEIPSYKNRLDRICNKVQRMVDDLDSNKSKKTKNATKRTFKQVVQEILTEGEERNDC